MTLERKWTYFELEPLDITEGVSLETMVEFLRPLHIAVKTGAIRDVILESRIVPDEYRTEEWLVVTARRPETDEEYGERVARHELEAAAAARTAEQAALALERQERQEYERLKAKFEGEVK